MHIVAISSSFAATINVLLALSIQEVSDWWEDSTDFFALEKSAIDVI